VRGNLQALFGKRPTEKDPAMGTSPAVDFTLGGPRCSNAPGLPGGKQEHMTEPSECGRSRITGRIPGLVPGPERELT
jgi:hypothetical protein